MALVEETMKTRLLGALVGLAISFALPTYAQQKTWRIHRQPRRSSQSVRRQVKDRTTTMAPPLPRYIRATRFLLRQRAQSPVGKPFRNGIQTCTSGGALKTTSTSWTGSFI